MCEEIFCAWTRHFQCWLGAQLEHLEGKKERVHVVRSVDVDNWSWIDCEARKTQGCKLLAGDGWKVRCSYLKLDNGAADQSYRWSDIQIISHRPINQASCRMFSNSWTGKNSSSKRSQRAAETRFKSRVLWALRIYVPTVCPVADIWGAWATRGHFMVFGPLKGYSSIHFMAFCPLERQLRWHLITFYQLEGHPGGH